MDLIINFDEFSEYEKQLIENLPESLFNKIETQITNNSLQMFVQDEELSDEKRMYIKAYRNIWRIMVEQFKKVIREKEAERNIKVKKTSNIIV